MVELSTIAPIVAGIPKYETLDIVTGKLAKMNACPKGRGPSHLNVEVDSYRGIMSISLPCTPELENMKQGSHLEIRSRPYSTLIFINPDMDVWSVRADGVELYSYNKRVVRIGNFIMNYFMATIPLFLAGFIFMAHKYGRKRSNN